MATYNGSSARNVWYGTSSADTASGNGGDDSLYGRAGNDTLNGGTGNDGLYGEDGNDALIGGDGVDALFGAAGADTLRGGNHDDYIVGGIGDDGLYGDAGKDRLRGEDGVDALFGGVDDDDLDGGAGNDYLAGGLGNDRIVGGTGFDRIRGEDGNDYLIGDGNDSVLGGVGNDTLVFRERSSGPYDAPEPTGTGVYDGGDGYDTLILDVQGTFGQDTAQEIYVNASRNSPGGNIAVVGDHVEPSGYYYAQALNFEEIRVAPGANRSAISVSGDFKVIGGDGVDYLEGWIGNQHFSGGAGHDHFQYAHRVGVNQGRDTITGFNKAEDRIEWNTEDYGSNGNGWDNYERHHVAVVEKNGHTIYTTSDTATGQVMHVLDVDAIGLPPPGDFLYG